MTSNNKLDLYYFVSLIWGVYVWFLFVIKQER